MNCEVKGFLGGVCRNARSSDPDFCQAQNQAKSDLELSKSDPLIADAATGLESDIARTYHGCPQLDDVIAGIRQELARRREEQNQNPSPLNSL